MKKQLSFLTAGVLLALGSCTNEGDTGMTQAQIDSTINARAEEIAQARMDELMMRNDSTINALAREKADSILVSMGKKPTTTTKKPTTKKEEPKSEDPKTSEPTNTGKNDGTKGENTGKKTGETGENTGKKR